MNERRSWCALDGTVIDIRSDIFSSKSPKGTLGSGPAAGIRVLRRLSRCDWRKSSPQRDCVGSCGRWLPPSGRVISAAFLAALRAPSRSIAFRFSN